MENAYVELIIGQINFYDSLAKKVLGRSPKHVIALHEYDDTALFIDSLIKKLKDDGWEFVIPLDAYKDPIYKLRPNVVGYQNIITAIAEEKGFDKSKTRYQYENPLEAVKIFNKWKSYSNVTYVNEAIYRLKKILRKINLIPAKSPLI